MDNDNGAPSDGGRGGRGGRGRGRGGGRGRGRGRGARIISRSVENPDNLRERPPQDRGGGGRGGRGGRGRGGGNEGPRPEPRPEPKPFEPKAPTHLQPTDDIAADRRRLREALHDKIDDVKDPNNPDKWDKKQREPCVSASWDRKSGRVYYNHNDRDTPVDPNKLDPILRERYKDFQDGKWEQQTPHNLVQYGEPGQHCEVRATNKALTDARAEGRTPELKDFWVDNANPKNKEPMRCCIQCTQMIDGADGSSSGWEVKDGKRTKVKNWDGHIGG